MTFRRSNGKWTRKDGKVSRLCCCTTTESPGCLCDDGPDEWPCWPCHSLHYEYVVNFTINWEIYESSDCSGEPTSTGSCAGPAISAYWYDICQWSSAQYEITSCSGFPLDQVGIGLWWDKDANAWKIRFNLSLTGGVGPFTPPDAVGGDVISMPYADTGEGNFNGIPAVECIKIWLTDITATGGTDPSCCAMECDTDAGNWTLQCFDSYPDMTAFCNAWPGATARHVVWGAQDFYTTTDGLSCQWTYARSWADGDCGCEASGAAFGLTGNATVIVTTPYCSYSQDCPVPALDTDEEVACP